MIHPTIRDYREDRRSHFISPTSAHPHFLGKSPLDLRWAKPDSPVNISKKDNLYEMEVAIPGFEKSDIEVFIQDKMLTIRAERRREEDMSSKYLLKEFDTDITIRRFELGDDIGHEKVTAEYINGILKLTFIDVPANRELPYKNVEVL